MDRRALPAPELPTAIRDLTPEWITGVLRAGKHLGDGRVVSVETEQLGEGEGFVGQIVRLRLGYAGASGPATVVAKLPIRQAGNRQLGEMLGAYEREVRFYQELADRVPIRKPLCYYAAMDPSPFAGREKESLEFLDKLPRWICRLLVPLGMWIAARSKRRYVLLLEDLGGGGRRVGDQIAGCSREEAEVVVREIARVHAAWWQRGELESLGWVAPLTILSRYAEAMYLQSRSAFHEQFGAERSSAFREFADWLARGGTPLMRRIADRPWTLVHGDYRLDNLSLSGEGAATRVVAFDWQGVTRGPGPFDVAYFVSGSLTPAVAAEAADDLLRAYHEELRAGGVDGYSFEDCLADYALGMLFVAYRMVAGLHLLDFTNERGTALIDEWFARIEAVLPADYRARVGV